MSHAIPGSPAIADVAVAPPLDGFGKLTPATVLVTEQQVLFGTAAALVIPAAPTRRRVLTAALLGEIERVRIRLRRPPSPYPHREAAFIEVARMAREMNRL